MRDIAAHKLPVLLVWLGKDSTTFFKTCVKSGSLLDISHVLVDLLCPSLATNFPTWRFYYRSVRCLLLTVPCVACVLVCPIVEVCFLLLQIIYLGRPRKRRSSGVCV
jgi:hypothetical protein